MFIRFITKTSQTYIKHLKQCPNRYIETFSRAMSSNLNMQNLRQKESFEDVLPKVINSILKHNKFTEIPEVGQWIEKIIKYNVQGGKKNRGLTTVFAYEMLEKPENISEDSLERARILGWCVEMIQAFFVMLDDIMDGSTTRRGVPCWYRNPEVGLEAINDAVLIQGSCLEVMKSHFQDKPYYKDLVELFNETIYLTSMGQYLDCMTAKHEKNDFSHYTMNRYNAIVKYKTAFYTYKLPVTTGFFLTNNSDKKSLQTIEDVCMDIGRFFQIQDDYIDVYGDPKVTGKIGTDIVEGKCSWLAARALELCSPAQRTVFNACYGSKEPAHIERIKQLYQDLNIKQMYKDQEVASYTRLRKKIEELPKDLSPQLFMKLINTIYQREY